MNRHAELAAFDFSSVISASGSVLKDNLPNLVQTGLQKRIAEINAKRAKKMQKPAAAPVATVTAPSPASYLPAAPAPAAGPLAVLSRLPSWVIPALIALVVAFIKLRNRKKK